MTAEEMFGSAVPGEAVADHGPAFNIAGGQPRGRFVRRSDGKPMRVDDIPRKVETMSTAAEAVLVENEAPTLAAEPARAELMRMPVATSDALVLQRDPNDMLAEATKAAKALMAVMKAKPDKVMMNGQQYIENEDWQTIGHFYGATAQLESDRFVEFGDVKGWEATVTLVARDGRVLGRATAMCLNDEEKWSGRTKYEWHLVMKNGDVVNEEEAQRRGLDAWEWEAKDPKRPVGKGNAKPKKVKVEVGTVAVPMFQLRSMAQTRASSKVHRTVLAFVPVLAGFSATPAEELPDAVREPNTHESRSPDGDGHVLESRYGNQGTRNRRDLPDGARTAPGQAGDGADPKGGVDVSVKQTRAGSEPADSHSDEGPDLGVADALLPSGFHLIDDYRLDGDWHHVTWGRDAQGGKRTYKTRLAKVGLEAHNAFTEKMPVMLTSNKFPYLDKVEKLGSTVEQIKASKFTPDDTAYCAKCGAQTWQCECRP